MRALVFLLILANLLFFAYAQGYLGSAESPDALRAQQQIHPERLQLLARGGDGSKEPEPVASVTDAAPAEPPASPQAPVVPEPKPAEAVPEKKPEAVPAPAPEPAPPKPAVLDSAQACLLLTGLSEADASRLAGEAGKASLTASRRSEGGWWVFMPPQPDKKGAEKKAGELQRLGVTEFFIVNDGPQKFAISLGVFSREEAAEKRLEQLRGQGVRTARVGPRSVEGARQLLEVKGGGSELAAFRKTLPEGSAPKDCP